MLTAEAQDPQTIDALRLGRRIRELRLGKGLTLDDLGGRIGRATSHVSVVERGKRELKVGDLAKIAVALDVTVDDLLGAGPADERARLEIALERAQRGPLFAALGLDALPMRKTLSTQAIETILALHDELVRVHRERLATPEEARRANTSLRRAMRARDNHFAELEARAADLLAAVGHTGGPLSQRVASELATHLGFSIHHVRDLPHSTRSLADREAKHIYLPLRDEVGRDQRTSLLQALAGAVLEHDAPADYAEFLEQRVQSNYLAAALLVPESAAVPLLAAAKGRRELSIDDLRDAFAVTYETAAHRFTNLVTRHLGIPVHFLKASESGAISKAYENDQVLFPADPLGAVEGQIVCRNWSARRVFDVDDRFSPYFQFTDKPNGTFWCTSSIQLTARGPFSVSVGTTFADSKWFRGRDTTVRFASSCPDPSCCRTPPAELEARWGGRALPTPRVDSSLFAALPTGAFPGVDSGEVYAFLERHARG